MDALRHADTSHLRQDIVSSGSAKLQQLSALRDQLVGGAKDVTALRASIASAVADIRAYTSDARTAAASAQIGAASAQSAQIALNRASEAAHSNVVNFMSDYYDQRKFDPYLKFTSATDEEEYRRREEERKRDIEKAIAERTPEGNLRANQLAIEQLKDAGAHGADRSPDYKPELDRLNATQTALQGEIASSAPGTPAKEQPQKPPTTSDAAAALRAAGVSLADASDTPCVASAKCTTSQIVRH